MKLFKYGLPFAALAMLASCSNDNLDGPNVEQADSQDALYVSMNFMQIGTRTSTPNQGSEEGTADENAITRAYLFFTPQGEENIIASSSMKNFNVASSGKNYYARGKVTRANLVSTMGGDTEKAFDLYVVANYPSTWLEENQYVGTGESVVTVSQLTQSISNSTDAQYWTGGSFLMSNSESASATIKAEDLVANRHADITDPLDLGSVNVQRAAARFDIAIPSIGEGQRAIKFGFKADGTPVEYNDQDVAVTLDFVGGKLVNLSKDFYLFKQTGSVSGETWTWGLFGNETASNYVKDPWMFQKAALTSASYEGSTYFFDDLESLKTTGLDNVIFAPFSTERLAGKVENGNSGDVIGEMGNNYTSATEQNYHFWSYATPSSVNDKTKQLNGNTTGIIFKAEMTFKDAATLGAQGGKNIYVFDNVVYGSFEKLQAVVDNISSSSPANDQEMAAYYGNAKKQLAEEAEENEENMKALLVSENFKVITPKQEADETYHYYCYYFYWNRHNDNGLGEMGPMEFAVVRNNIYKIAVNSVKAIGFPGDPDNTPEYPDPDIPDETTDLYMAIQVVVVDWNVRVNNVDF